MTTFPNPPRTVLPPNLTRNYYEVKRIVAEGEGRALPHWYQLTAEQQKAEDLEVEMFRQAILRSEEEQDLVAQFNAPAAVAICPCPDCCTVRVLRDVIRQAKRLRAALGGDIDGSGEGATAADITLVSLTAKGRADLERQAREVVGRWFAAGKPSVETAPLEVKLPPLSREYLDRLTKQLLREPYRSGYPVFITDLWGTRPPTVDNA